MSGEKPSFVGEMSAETRYVFSCIAWLESGSWFGMKGEVGLVWGWVGLGLVWLFGFISVCVFLY